MARKIVHLPPVAPETWDTGNADSLAEAGARAVFEAMRDALRTDLAALGVKVSDIGIWTTGTYTGMIFECHDPTANNSLYVIGGYSSNTNPPDVDDILGLTGTNLRTRAKSIGVAFASASASPGSGLAILHNPDTTISRADLDFDDATELTYTGGDYTTLTTVNPDSLAGLQAISPSHATYGMTTDLHGNDRCAHCLGYDSTAKVWLYAMETSAGTSGSEGYVMWGPALDPSADANEYATLYVWGSRSSTTGMRGIAHTYAEVNAFDPGGTSRDYDLSPDEDLDSGNYKVSGGLDDGKLNWKKVEVNNGTGGSGVKGHVKENLFVEIGIYRDGGFRLRPIQFPDTANPVVCVTESCAIWWEDGARLFPSYFSYNRF